MFRYVPPEMLDGSNECFCLLQIPMWEQRLSIIMVCVGIGLVLGAGFLAYLIKEENKQTNVFFYSCVVSGFFLGLGGLMMGSSCS